MEDEAERISSKAYIFWPTLTFVYALDFITKRLVEEYLRPAHVPHQVVGDLIRFTLAYNKDAAMGLSLGGYSRVGFTAYCNGGSRRVGGPVSSHSAK